MKILLVKWVMGALVFMLAAELVPGLTIDGPYIALVSALLWGVVYVTIRPIIILITLPINVLTFGLFTFIINALLLLFLSTFITGFKLEGMAWALVAALVVAVLSWFSNRLIASVVE